MRRWVAQGTGTFAITGSASDADTTAGGNNVTVTIKKNGTTIYGPTTIVSGSTAITTISGRSVCSTRIVPWCAARTSVSRL